MENITAKKWKPFCKCAAAIITKRFEIFCQVTAGKSITASYSFPEKCRIELGLHIFLLIEDIPRSAKNSVVILAYSEVRHNMHILEVVPVYGSVALNLWLPLCKNIKTKQTLCIVGVEGFSFVASHKVVHFYLNEWSDARPLALSWLLNQISFKGFSIMLAGGNTPVVLITKDTCRCPHICAAGRPVNGPGMKIQSVLF